MSSIERTAYPRFSNNRIIKEKELHQCYSLTADELRYIQKNIRGDLTKLNFAVQLKTFQKLGHFPKLNQIPFSIIDHIKNCLGLQNKNLVPFYDHDNTQYRHQDRICEYLKIERWRKEKNKNGKQAHPGRHLAIKSAHNASQTMNNPADIINVVIEELIHHRYELPPFHLINRLVKHVRYLVNRNIFRKIYLQLNRDMIKKCDDLLTTKTKNTKTGYHALKRPPKNPTISHFKELIRHHDWLMSFENTDDYLKDISKIKLQQFAAEAKSMDASDYKNMTPHRKYALIIF